MWRRTCVTRSSRPVDPDPEFQRFLWLILSLQAKKAAGEERWYEKIPDEFHTGSSGTTPSRPKEANITHSSFSKDWQNYMTHTIPIQASFTAFGYLTLTPSFTFCDLTSLIKQSKHWDVDAQKEVTGYHQRILV